MSKNEQLLNNFLTIIIQKGSSSETFILFSKESIIPIHEKVILNVRNNVIF